jgi:integrase
MDFKNSEHAHPINVSPYPTSHRAYQIMQRFKKLFDYKISINPYKLRKSFGSFLYNDLNVPISWIADLMGNSDKICKKYYVRVSDKLTEENSNKMNQIDFQITQKMTLIQAPLKLNQLVSE